MGDSGRWPAGTARRVRRLERWLPSGAGHHRIAQAVGIGLFVVGFMVFALEQTQELLRNSFDFSISANQSGRNDGGILFGAFVAGAGAGLLGLTVSRLPALPRLRNAALFGVGVALLAFLHFSIFVNSLAMPGAGLVALRASFLFHDSSEYIPIALFILALATLLLLAVIAFAALRLLSPTLLERHIVRPVHEEDHRARLVLVAMLLLGAGAAFVRQFLDYALYADADAAGGFLSTNMVFLYYVMALALALALVTMSYRTYRLVWGDMREKRSVAFQRVVVPLRQTETWLLAFVGVLTVGVLLAPPVVQPSDTTEQVFAVNSRGTSIFLLLLLPLLHWQRRAERHWIGWLRHTPRDFRPQHIAHRTAATVQGHAQDLLQRIDRLGWFVITIGGGWLVLSLLTWSTSQPLTSLALRLAFIALVAPWFALRFRFHDASLRPELRGPGTFAILVSSAMLSFLVGLMLWGQGNSVTTFYSTNGGFVTAESSVLQPYSTGIRLLGSLFMAAPAVLLIWFHASRFADRVHPGPLLVLGFAMVIGLNLLFTINAEDPTNTALRQSEVVVGYYVVSLRSATDKAFLLVLWSAVVAIGNVAALRLLTRRRGRDTARTSRTA